MHKNNRQIQINLLTNVLSLIVSILIGLFYTPYLVRSLGMVAYGIVPLALIINQYINVITGSLTGSLTRFYSIALQKKDYKNASRYLSTSFAVIFLLFIGLLPLIILLITHIDHVFNIPSELILSTKKLFAFTIVSFFLSIISSVFNISLYALNRLDRMNLIKILRMIFKFVWIILFFEWMSKDVVYIGYANLFTEILVLVVSLFLFKKNLPQGVYIGYSLLSKEALWSVLGMTIWVLIHQIGDTALYRIDNILVNLFWGTRESGILGALSEFGSYVMLIVSVFGTLFGPLILIEYAKENHHKVQELTLNNSLLVGVLTAIIAGSLIGFSKSIIYFWLGSEFIEYSIWFVIKIATIPFYTAAGIFAFTYRAWNKMKFPALATVVIGLINLIVMYILFAFFSSNPYIISIALVLSAILIILQSYGLNGGYFNYVYTGHRKILFLNFFKIVFSLLLAIVFSLIQSLFLSDSLPSLLIGLIANGLICLSVIYFVVLNKEQRKDLLSIMCSKSRC